MGRRRVLQRRRHRSFRQRDVCSVGHCPRSMGRCDQLPRPDSLVPNRLERGGFIHGLIVARRRYALFSETVLPTGIRDWLFTLLLLPLGAYATLATVHSHPLTKRARPGSASGSSITASYSSPGHPKRLGTACLPRIRQQPDQTPSRAKRALTLSFKSE